MKVASLFRGVSKENFDRQVRDMLLAGKSDDDIRNYMVARYGEFILFRPRTSLKNAWLWMAPGVLILVGAFVIAFRERSARGRALGHDNRKTRGRHGQQGEQLFPLN